MVADAFVLSEFHRHRNLNGLKNQRTKMMMKMSPKMKKMIVEMTVMRLMMRMKQRCDIN